MTRMGNTIKVLGTFKGSRAVDVKTVLFSFSDSEGVIENGDW